MPRAPRARKREREIQPDEIFIDSANVAEFDTDRFEGRIERPLGRRSILFVSTVAVLCMLVYGARAFDLQFIRGVAYATQAAENKLTEKTVFADRGVIADRAGRELAYNERILEEEYAKRIYAPYEGVAHVVGYTKPPAKDSSGFYFRESYEGIDGAEQIFNTELAGTNGLVLTETDARGDIVSESTRRFPETGKKITLSIDAKVSEGLYETLKARIEGSGFEGGAGVIMDVSTGELLALTSVPEYSPAAVSRGDSETLAQLLADPNEPFLDRAVHGLYAPGSIVKPFVALGALAEGVIDEYTKIVSTGAISVPNPYDPTRPTIFRDWRAHGAVDMRRAIAVSSDVYFYEVGGGFENQKGLGIDNIDKYFTLFGFGSPTGLQGIEEPSGTIPTPAWKEEHFPGDPWRIGNTYHTAIGQYGVQVTPLQAVRATAAIANGGRLLTPSLLASSTPDVTSYVNLDKHYYDVVHEGMRMSVTEGIAGGVNMPFVQVAAKTGTAEVGAKNEYINSWMVGFFPYENPRYAFAVVLERAPTGTTIGASAAMGAFLQWMQANAPHYLK